MQSVTEKFPRYQLEMQLKQKKFKNKSEKLHQINSISSYIFNDMLIDKERIKTRADANLADKIIYRLDYKMTNSFIRKIGILCKLLVLNIKGILPKKILSQSTQTALINSLKKHAQDVIDRSELKEAKAELKEYINSKSFIPKDHYKEEYLKKAVKSFSKTLLNYLNGDKDYYKNYYIQDTTYSKNIQINFTHRNLADEYSNPYIQHEVQNFIKNFEISNLADLCPKFIEIIAKKYNLVMDSYPNGTKKGLDLSTIGMLELGSWIKPFDNIQFLNAGNTYLPTAFKEIGNLKNLEYLWTHVWCQNATLPDSMINLKNIKYIHINLSFYCKINISTALAIHFIKQEINMNTFNIQLNENDYKTLDNELPSSFKKSIMLQMANQFDAVKGKISGPLAINMIQNQITSYKGIPLINLVDEKDVPSILCTQEDLHDQDFIKSVRDILPSISLDLKKDLLADCIAGKKKISPIIQLLLHLDLDDTKEIDQTLKRMELKHWQFLKDLGPLNLKSIGSWIKDFKLVERLNLNTSGITNIPEEIVHLTDLKILDIANSKITEMPDFLIKMKNLENIVLGDLKFELSAPLAHHFMKSQTNFVGTNKNNFVLNDVTTISAFTFNLNEINCKYLEKLDQTPETHHLIHMIAKRTVEGGSKIPGSLAMHILKNDISLSEQINLIEITDLQDEKSILCKPPIYNKRYFDFINGVIPKLPLQQKQIILQESLNGTQEISPFIELLLQLDLHVTKDIEQTLEKLNEKDWETLKQYHDGVIHADTIDSWIKDFIFVKTLHLQSDMITSLSDEIGDLSHLETLDITQTKITELPDSLIRLDSIKHLNAGALTPKISTKLAIHFMNRNIDYKNFKIIVEKDDFDFIIQQPVNDDMRNFIKYILSDLHSKGQKIPANFAIHILKNQIEIDESIDLSLAVIQEQLPSILYVEPELENAAYMNFINKVMTELTAQQKKLILEESFQVNTKIAPIIALMLHLNHDDTLQIDLTLKKMNSESWTCFNNCHLAHIKSVGKWIADFKSLTHLRLDNSNLKEIPDEIKSLTDLQELDISNCQITELPNWLSSLTHLKKIDGGKNQFQVSLELYQHLIKNSIDSTKFSIKLDQETINQIVNSEADDNKKALINDIIKNLSDDEKIPPQLALYILRNKIIIPSGKSLLDLTDLKDARAILSPQPDLQNSQYMEFIFNTLPKFSTEDKKSLLNQMDELNISPVISLLLHLNLKDIETMHKTLNKMESKHWQSLEKFNFISLLFPLGMHFPEILTQFVLAISEEEIRINIRDPKYLFSIQSIPLKYKAWIGQNLPNEVIPRIEKLALRSVFRILDRQMMTFSDFSKQGFILDVLFNRVQMELLKLKQSSQVSSVTFEKFNDHMQLYVIQQEKDKTQLHWSNIAQDHLAGQNKHSLILSELFELPKDITLNRRFIERLVCTNLKSLLSDPVIHQVQTNGKTLLEDLATLYPVILGRLIHNETNDEVKIAVISAISKIQQDKNIELNIKAIPPLIPLPYTPSLSWLTKSKSLINMDKIEYANYEDEVLMLIAKLNTLFYQLKPSDDRNITIKAFQQIMNDIFSKTVKVGTPKAYEREALNNYYIDMLTNLKFIVQQVELKKDDEDFVLSNLRQCAMARIKQVCSTGDFEEIRQTAYLLCPQADSFEGVLEQSAYKALTNVIAIIANSLYGGDVHAYSQLYYVTGMSNIPDSLNYKLTIEQAFALIQQLWNTEHILDLFKSNLKDVDQEILIDWFKDHTPPDFPVQTDLVNAAKSLENAAIQSLDDQLKKIHGLTQNQHQKLKTLFQTVQGRIKFEERTLDPFTEELTQLLSFEEKEILKNETDFNELKSLFPANPPDDTQEFKAYQAKRKKLLEDLQYISRRNMNFADAKKKIQKEIGQGLDDEVILQIIQCKVEFDKQLSDFAEKNNVSVNFNTRVFISDALEDERRLRYAKTQMINLKDISEDGLFTLLTHINVLQPA